MSATRQRPFRRWMSTTVAVVGAGPVGLTAALAAHSLGLDPVLLEAQAPPLPAELAPAYVLLASQEGSFMTGEVIGATGGSTPF